MKRMRLVTGIIAAVLLAICIYYIFARGVDDTIYVYYGLASIAVSVLVPALWNAWHSCRRCR